MKKEKKLSPWQIFTIRKELATELKKILKKVINKEELTEIELKFLQLLIERV